MPMKTSSYFIAFAFISLKFFVSINCFCLSTLNIQHQTKLTKHVIRLDCQNSKISNFYTISSSASLFSSALLLPNLKHSGNSVLSFISTLYYNVMLYLMLSAARRNRLDGNTFKLINLGLFTSSISFLLYGLTQISSFGMRAYNLLTFQSLVNLVFTIKHMSSLVASLLVLQNFKLPVIKTDFKNYLSVGYLIGALISLFHGAFMIWSISRHNLTTVSIPFVDLVTVRSLLMPVGYLALSGAASAGHKRLSSETYKILNLSSMALVLIGIISSHLFRNIKNIISISNCLLAAPVVLGIFEVLISTIGYIRGAAYVEATIQSKP